MALVAIGSTGAAFAAAPVKVQAGDVEARITLSSAHSSGGSQLGVTVDFAIAPGWHIYGEPLPAGEGLTPTSIRFEDDLVARQKLNFPKPIQRKFAALNETYPVYEGHFIASGTIALAPTLKRGDYSVAGTLSFQECNDSICKMPQSVRFVLPLKIE